MTALAQVCRDRPAGEPIQVYELHNGKGPRYFLEPLSFGQELSAALAGISSDQSRAVEIVAVGCGAADASSPADCSRAVVLLFGTESQVAALPPLLVALVLVRDEGMGDWSVEKVWTPFPTAIPSPIPDGYRVGINTLAAVKAVELYPYEAE